MQPRHCEASHGEEMEKKTVQIRVTISDGGPGGFQRISFVVDGIADESERVMLRSAPRGGEGGDFEGRLVARGGAKVM